MDRKHGAGLTPAAVLTLLSTAAVFAFTGVPNEDRCDRTERVRAALLLAAIVSAQPAPSKTVALMPRADDYTLMWRADGFPTRAKHAHAHGILRARGKNTVYPLFVMSASVISVLIEISYLVTALRGFPYRYFEGGTPMRRLKAVLKA